jgi:hypothetical protein
MITLTYAQSWLWEPMHVSRFMDEVRRWSQRRGWSPAHVWVLELQRRGAPHYHVIVWMRSDLARSLPYPDKCGWWPWGFTHRVVASRPVGYLMKYATKLESKHQFPHGARIHGRGGLDQAERLTVRWWVMPRYQRDRCRPQDDVVRARGGGWVSRSTGEWWPPWQPVG